MGMRLYEIPAVIDAILEDGFTVDEETGEVWDESDLDALDMALDDKLEATACYVKNLTAEADALKAEAATLSERAKAKSAKAERMRDYINRSMERAGKAKLETSKCALTTRKTERVEVLDVDMVPDILKHEKVTWTPDKLEIKKRIKAGDIIPGCALVSSRSLTIK